MKQIRGLGDAFKRIGNQIQTAVAEKLGIPVELFDHPLVHEADRVAVYTEALHFGMDAMDPAQRVWVPAGFVPDADILGLLHDHSTDTWAKEWMQAHVSWEFAAEVQAIEEAESRSLGWRRYSRTASSRRPG